MNAIIRSGRDNDAAGFIALIRVCWAEYPGCILDVDGELPELRALASYFTNQGGALWTVEADGAVVGMAGVVRSADGFEIRKFYVDAGQRGTGLAQRLLGLAEDHARAAGATRLILWTDTRFDRAHGFYEKHSYVRHGPIRVMHDLSQSLEFGYAKPVFGIERLDAAASASAVRRLADILVACVDGGASVSFLRPLAMDKARTFYRGVAADVAAGQKILLAGWVDGVLAGTVLLNLATPENQPHRADVQKLLVHPDARRKGLGRALMLRIELEALQAGRFLLTLDTNAGDPGEALYRGLGWTEAGRIPFYSLNAEHVPWPTVLFWKRVDP